MKWHLAISDTLVVGKGLYRTGLKGFEERYGEGNGLRRCLCELFATTV